MKTAILRLRPKTKLGAGMAFLITAGLLAIGLGYKAPILTHLRSGETITAEFASSYRLRPNESKVKFAGLTVGVVSGVKYTSHGTVLVSMKVDDSTVDVLGNQPTAQIAPLTILGGVYSVELDHGGGGGRFGGTFIPRNRTKTPVELDRILEALPRNTRAHVQSLVGRLTDSLGSRSQAAIGRLAHQAPGTFPPATRVFEAAQGTRPDRDLQQIVSNFYTISQVLTKRSGQLGETMTSLDRATGALADQADALGQGIATLPTTLRNSRTGLTALGGALDRLHTTAHNFDPAVKELNPLLQQANPVLKAARPLMRDLRPLMAQARPLMNQLAPAVGRGTDVINQIRGPVIDRINGPVTNTVMNTWRGVGPYRGNGAGPQADHKFYQELGYLTANMDRASMTQDAQGSMLGFQVAVGADSLQGVPFTLPNLMAQMLKVVGGAR